jgi:Peptidoglycan-synthase activator LpoB
MRHITSIVLLIALTLPVVGCNVLGVAAYKLSGPTKVPAQHELGATPTLVLAERSRDAFQATTVDADRLARVISNQLQATGKLTIVSQDELDRVRATRLSDFNTMSTKDIAKAVGAKQVLYVDLRQIKVEATAGDDLFKGNSVAAVRVIDTETSEVVWPVGASDGAPVFFETKPIGKSSRQASLSRAATVDGLGEKIAKMFYAWMPENEMPIED